MSEIRSFRRVFDLERRIYTIDRLRLNPSGVPVRGVLYMLLALAASMLLSSVPLLGAPLRAVPWYLRELALPGALAAMLAVVRVDGRSFHLAARAQLRLLTTPKRTTGLERASSVGARWRPPDLLLLPDGSDERLRALRYRGPGAVRVIAAHRRLGVLERNGVGVSRRPVLRLAAARGAQAAEQRVIWLERGSSMLVESDEIDRPR